MAWWIYEPALDGPFVSDDLHYVARNAYVHGLSAENVWAILQPTGDVTLAVVNYSPVQLLIHAAAWEVFGDRVQGHHAVNVLLHALASFLLVLLLLRTGVPRAAAICGGAFFLLHPANVEAVAWISQLKTTSCMVLSLGSLLAFASRRSALGVVLFALALLAKATAAFVLPVAVLLAWSAREPLPWRAYAVCAVLFAAYALVELTVHQRSGAAEAVLYETPLVLLRTMAALAARYLWMAATGLGVSTFHEPSPAYSWLDPWWLVSLPLLGALAARSLASARGRQPECAYWAWAVVSYAPVSQIFPFLYPLADRYLYFILPGLIGGTLLAGNALWPRLPEPRRGVVGWIALALALPGLLSLAVRSHQRAEIWSSPAKIVADAARHYPDGVSAQLGRAKQHVALGDAPAAAAAIRAAVRRGYNRFDRLLADPAFAPIRHHPAFDAILRELAAGWIAKSRAKARLTQSELRSVAHAHVVREEIPQAEAALREALAVGGPHEQAIRRELAALAQGGRL